MSKHMLLAASETGLAANIRAHANRAGLECELAVGEMDSTLSIHSRAPTVVIVCDHPMRRALTTCDALVPVTNALLLIGPDAPTQRQACLASANAPAHCDGSRNA